jgi:hypothetical protein
MHARTGGCATSTFGSVTADPAQLHGFERMSLRGSFAFGVWACTHPEIELLLYLARAIDSCVTYDTA